ncbi:MAG: 16S rRNA (uracil(1498)-N(3))-methyltransferase [Ignavibacteria bacterium]|nr:16S rRNA (uracil(1498)-N(3))-methyltransferase [Ignavibacteria bacterium]
MEYYYTPKEYISSGSLTIVDDEAKHLGKVLRKNAGDELYVTDGLGNLFRVKITSAEKAHIECTILEKLPGINEPERNVTLYQSLIKNPDRFEFSIEKSVELGVYEIFPLITEHTINKTSNKVERWQSIALSAMKQSQRCLLPKVNAPLTFADAAASCKADVKLIADETASNNESGFHRFADSESIAVFVGPEGGFSPEEIQLAVSNGFERLSLGPRKFRSETASILALGLILCS